MIFRSIISACVFVMLVAITAHAAVVPNTPEKLRGNKQNIFWETFTEVDTTEEALWRGGCGLLEATGTQDSAEFELQWGAVSGTLSDVDSRVIPDGAAFDGTSGLGVVRVNLPAGFVSMSLTSAGGATQDIDVRLIPYNGCE